jgi:hypothetical protein
LGLNIVTLTLAFSTGPKTDHIKDIKIFQKLSTGKIIFATDDVFNNSMLLK